MRSSLLQNPHYTLHVNRKIFDGRPKPEKGQEKAFALQTRQFHSHSAAMVVRLAASTHKTLLAFKKRHFYNV